LNFVARLAPVSEPRRLMSDKKPVFKVDYELLTSAANLFYNPPVIDVEADDNDEKDDNADIDEEMSARYGGGSSSDADETDDADISNIDTEAENYNRYYHKQ
ncbi:MAG: hypothetical protein ABIK68_19830, partial [bacterium]